METRKRKEITESEAGADASTAPVEPPNKLKKETAEDTVEQKETAEAPAPSSASEEAQVAAAAPNADNDSAPTASDSPPTASAVPETPPPPAAEIPASETPSPVPPKPYTPEEIAHWNQMFYELMMFRAKNGNVNVKSTDRNHQELYKWIVQLRRDYKARERDPAESPLTVEQIKVLESVRFAFTTRGEEHWQKNYEKLKEYKATHGHVLVPRQCEIPGLGDWVTSQRQQYQEYIKGRPTPLTKQRKELLDELGFQYRIRNRPEWGAKYKELLEYKEKHGDTRVPQHYKANKPLGKWVAKQREQYKLFKKGKHSFLSPDRLEKLASIGFCWTIRGEVNSKSTRKSAGHSTAAQMDAAGNGTAAQTDVVNATLVGKQNGNVKDEQQENEKVEVEKKPDPEVKTEADTEATKAAEEGKEAPTDTVMV